MIIHPPILFVGYALLAVPFAFALAGLWRRDYDGWVRQALPWALAGWSFLGLALLLGGYWAYETLGWGGYWGWDPVENSALVPWLTTTALIHAMITQRTHGGLRRATFLLAIVTYILVFYATFLTRSGVLSSFSVHSFVEEGLKYVMTTALAVCAFGGLAFLVWRWRDIPARPLSEKLLSRDSFVVLMILGLLVVAAVDQRRHIDAGDLGHPWRRPHPARVLWLGVPDRRRHHLWLAGVHGWALRPGRQLL